MNPINQKELSVKSRSIFDHTYDLYSAPLYGYVIGLLGINQKSDEVFIQAFLHIWENLETFNDRPERLFIWMLKIAARFVHHSIPKANTKLKVQNG